MSQRLFNGMMKTLKLGVAGDGKRTIRNGRGWRILINCILIIWFDVAIRRKFEKN